MTAYFSQLTLCHFHQVGSVTPQSLSNVYILYLWNKLSQFQVKHTANLYFSWIFHWHYSWGTLACGDVWPSSAVLSHAFNPMVWRLWDYFPLKFVQACLHSCINSGHKGILKIILTNSAFVYIPELAGRTRTEFFLDEITPQSQECTVCSKDWEALGKALAEGNLGHTD